MRTSIFSVISLIVSSMFLFNCQKDTPKATMQFTVIDSSGNKIENASIKLYLSLAAMQDADNQVYPTKYTDSLGKAIFTNLSPNQYFYFIQNGCFNNANGTVATNGVIAANETNNVTCILSGTGSFSIKFTSGDAYDVYLNGEFQVNIGSYGAAAAPIVINNVPVGIYTLEFVDLTNSSFTTFTGKMKCGETINVQP